MFIADWFNVRLRKMPGYKTSEELFDFELDKIYAFYFSKRVQLVIVI